jgi:trk system potassium uptake protein TrkH
MEEKTAHQKFRSSGFREATKPPPARIFLLTLTHEVPFLDLTFEVASAFATVGLSRGATGTLDGLGYAVVEVFMFIGRIGPLALAFVLAAPLPSRIRHPQGRLFIG